MFSLSKSAIGLDIADHSIEVVELSNTGKQTVVLCMNRVNIAPGIVEHGRIKDETALTEILTRLFAEANPKPITGTQLIFGLSESQVYTHAFRLPELSEKAIKEALPRAMQRVIPLPMDDIIYSYKIIQTTPGKNQTLDDADGVVSEVVVVAASKTVVQEWTAFFQKLGYDIDAFDIESLAIFRDLYKESPVSPVCIVDIGSRTTNVSFFDERGLRYSHIEYTAGEAITEAIAADTGVDIAIAEQQKQDAGIGGTPGKATAHVIDTIIQEIQSAIVYFEKKCGSTIGEVVLVGGTSIMPGLLERVSQDLGVPVRIGSSVVLHDQPGVVYLEAVGLALRGIEKKWDKRDPAIPSVQRATQKTSSISFLKRITAHSVAQPRNQEQPTAPTSTRRTDDVLQSIEKGNKAQIILLFAILIVGFVAILLAFSYRENQRTAREITQENILQQAIDSIPEKEPLPEKVITVASTSTPVFVSVIGTQGDIVNIYAAADEVSQVLATTTIGTVFTRVPEDASTQWVHIQVNASTTGWVMSEYVEEIAVQGSVDEE